MPIYEYRCLECDRQFERMQKFSDPAIEVCPCDRAAAVQKLISRSAFHLKGSGWYVTDYAAKKTEKNEKSEKAASGESTAATETASKVKDEAKAAPKEKASKPSKE